MYVLLYAMATNGTTAELVAFVDDLVRCETRLYNALSDRVRAEHGIVATQYEFLRYFRDHPGARVADTAANFAAGIGAISKGVDRLESRGWVRRHPNPTDRRSSLVSLTSDGAAVLSAADETWAAALDEFVAATLTPTELAAAGNALSALRHQLEQNRIGLPVG